MSRLFISLLICIVLALVGFYFTVQYAPEKLLNSLFLQYQKQTYQGTVYMLDNRLEAAENKDQALIQIQKMFGYDIQLSNIEDVDLSKNEIKQLKNHGVFNKTIDNADHVYYPSRQGDDIWILQTEQTETEDYRRIATGTITLIEDQLRRYPADQWAAQVSKLNEHFSFNLELNPIAELNLQDPLKNRVLGGELIATGYETDDEYYYFRLFDSPYYLHIGPVNDFWLAKYLNYGVLTILAILLSLAILVWLFPLWKNLMALRHAASELGKGKFDTRVSAVRYSPIKKISDSFNLMATHIQSLIISHKDLTNAVSHELRTPLTRLKFGLNMMNSSKNETTRQHYIKEMNTDIDELDALITELLTYAQFDREDTQLVYQEFAVLKWLQKLVSRFETLTKDKPLITNFNSLKDTDYIQVEPTLMARALSNLITNAIRHANQTIRLSAHFNDSVIIFMVDDDGDGIDPHLKETLFKPFKRTECSRDRDSGGFGLGLAIVKQIVVKHKGTITLGQSDLGGASFNITIPINKQIT